MPSKMAAQGDTVREWREQVARGAINIGFEPLSDAPFRATFTPIFERIVRIAHSPGITFRDEGMVKDGEDHFSLILSQSRNLDVAHCRRNLRLGSGDATLVHVCEVGSIGSHDDVRYRALIVPELKAHCSGLDGAVMQRLPRQSEALQLLRQYLHSIEKNGIGHSPVLRETIRRHITELIALAITHSPMGESRLSAITTARLNAALDHVAACFRDPELSVVAVARSQGISPRYLQRLLEAAGTSFTDRVNELRLQSAFTLLTDTGNSTRRISDIALQIGFSDISHFNRLFRMRFGDTPSGVRGQNRPRLHSDAQPDAP